MSTGRTNRTNYLLGGYTSNPSFNITLGAAYITKISTIPEIKNVIFNNPATIVVWEDGTKTVVKCQEGDVFDKEKGLALCIIKKLNNDKGNFNDIFKKWCIEGGSK